MTSSEQTLNIAIVGDLLAGFPKGYADVRYIRLLSMGLVQAGAKVNVLIPGWSDKCFDENSRLAGEVNGVGFEHLSGAVCGRFSLFKRQWLKIRSWIMLRYRLYHLYKQGELDAIIYDPWHFKYTMLLSKICRKLRIPLFFLFVEWPPEWEHISEKEKTDYLSKYNLALSVANGFIVISDYLRDRCREADAVYGINRPCHVIPILLDNEPWLGIGSYTDNINPYILYCGSLDNYLDDVMFVLAAFAKSGCEDYRLLLIGGANTKTLEIINRKAQELGIFDSIEIYSEYLQDDEVLKLYVGAEALLAPLSNDVRSLARFPSKLADYLYSGRPVVTNAIGEINKYLHDGKSAFIANPDDINGFAQKISDAIFSQSRNIVGENGKQVAEREFSIGVQGLNLKNFIENIVKPDC